MYTMTNKPTVIDFFCGSGGFSEGFRQQGFDVVMGVENWKPAVETHNLNHGLEDGPMDVLRYEKSVDAIEELPDTDVIIGSPPCIAFSMSNKAGKADKTLGIRLIKAYLRIIAVKKHKKGSKLQAWLMENVPNARNYTKPEYTFVSLGLSDWAKSVGKEPSDVALRARENGGIIVASDYGAPQKRERFVCGEIVKTGAFPEPKKTHDEPVPLGHIKGRMPSPAEKKGRKSFTDPNYPGLKVSMTGLTDHFYDTGVYESEWRTARFAKVNHPFMGKMSFPENEKRPSRTVMATRSASTREALLYKSEFRRKGDGEYRLPTIREAASLMGFPFTYQFVGSEGTKWKLIGNAVCPAMSAALARSVRKELGLEPTSRLKLMTKAPSDSATFRNLNTFSKAQFDNPPRRKQGAKFRRHPIKEGNLTIALMNYDPTKANSKPGKKWYSVACVGSGTSHRFEVIPAGAYVKLRKIILAELQAGGLRFVTEFDKRFKGAIATDALLQEMFETHENIGKHTEPGRLVEEIAEFIVKSPVKAGSGMIPNVGLDLRESVPKDQLLAMYAMNRILPMTKPTTRKRAKARQAVG